MEKNQIFTGKFSAIKLIVAKPFFAVALGVCAFNVSAQSAALWKRSYDVKLGIGSGFRVLWNTNPTPRSTYTSQGLNDSFRIHDASTALNNFGVAVNFSKSDRAIIGIGVNYAEWGFDRIKNGGMYGYQPHPDLEVYYHLVDGPVQELTYNFQQKYLSFDLQFMQRLDGLKFQLENTKLFFLGSFSPSLLVQDALVLRSAGFTLAEGKNVKTYDFYYTPGPDDRPVLNKVRNPKINAFLGIGLRAEYTMAEGMIMLLQPRVQATLVPNHTGVQTASGVNASVELGFIFR